jgi:hypothetical protein
MQEKDMVSDALNQLKSSLTTYSSAIGECENQQLRQTLQQMRDKCEQDQYELYQIAKSRNYYQPAMQAQSHEIQQLRSQFMQGGQQGNMQQGMQGMQQQGMNQGMQHQGMQYHQGLYHQGMQNQGMHQGQHHQGMHMQ